MIDITDCRDLITLQTLIFIILFLQATAKLSTCYSYVGVALRACCRLGLHRNLNVNFSPIEREERKRLFWLVRKMDSYVGALLGLPQMLSDDDIDQQMPAEVDDEFITKDAILPQPSERFALIRASNAHTRLVGIMKKVVRYIYPIRSGDKSSEGDHYTINHSRIREIEQDLQVWMDHLAVELRPTDDAPRELGR